MKKKYKSERRALSFTFTTVKATGKYDSLSFSEKKTHTHTHTHIHTHTHTQHTQRKSEKGMTKGGDSLRDDELTFPSICSRNPDGLNGR